VTLREFFVTLGIDANTQSWMKAIFLVDSLESALGFLKDKALEAFHAIIDSVGDMAKEASNVSKVSQRFGMTTDAVQEMQFAFKMSGLSAEDMTHALTVLSRTAYGAKDGTNETADAFAALGIHLKDSTTGHLKPANVLFAELADRMSKMKDGLDKAGIAQKIFSRNGDVFIPILNKGSDGLQKLYQKAHALHLVMSTETIKSSKEYIQTNRNLDAALQGLGAALTEPFIRSSKLKEALTGLIESSIEWANAMAEETANALAEALDWAADAADGLLKSSKAALDWLEKHWKIIAWILGTVALAAVVVNIGALGELAGELTLVAALYARAGYEALIAGAKAALAMLPAVGMFLLVTVLIGLAILFVEDLWQAFTGGESVFADLWAEVKDFFNGIIWAITGMTAGALWDKLAAAVKGAFNSAFEWIAAKFKTISDLIPDSVKSALGFGGGAAPGPRAVNDFIGGGAASPEASVAASPGGQGPLIAAPSFQAEFTINAAPGVSAEETAKAVVPFLDEWHGRKMSEAIPAVGR
jgi:hypothetical protein